MNEKPKAKAEPTQQVPQVRTWTSGSGKFSVEAAFVSQVAGKVKLKKADGKIITIDAQSLSATDRNWIKSRADSAAAAR